MTQEVTARQLQAAGLSRSYAHHVLAGTRQVGVPLALWLLDEHGIAVGPVAGKSKAELRLLRTMYEPRAPESVLQRVSAANDPSPSAEAA